MREADFAEFSQMLDAVCGLLSRGAYTPTAPNTALWFRVLSAYDVPSVRAGFDAHVRDPKQGRFVPTPADIIGKIVGAAANDGRPGPDEAWSIALRGADEFDTVVWTAEMAQAWAACKPVFDEGDKIGARMAFREAYARLVEQARRERRPVAWEASLGFDPQRREVAVMTAIEAGRLLSAPADVLRVEGPGLAALANSNGCPPDVREQLMALRDALTRQYDGPSESEIERDRTVRLKADTAAKMAAYDGVQP